MQDETGIGKYKNPGLQNVCLQNRGSYCTIQVHKKQNLRI